MTDTLSVRELRNDVSEVLRRAEAGEHFVVTVSGRPVAELGPISGKPRFMSLEKLETLLEGRRADPGLVDDLKRLNPDTTDDLVSPWDR